MNPFTSFRSKLSEGPMDLLLSLLDPRSRGALFQVDLLDRICIFHTFSTVKLLAANDRDLAVLYTGVRQLLQRLLTWEHLTVLHVTAQNLSQAAVSGLVGAHLPNLTNLFLKCVSINAQHAYHLADNFACHLKQLHLCRMQLSANCLKKLTHDHTLSWRSLTSLRLEEVVGILQEPQMKQLAPEQFPQLQILGLSGCRLNYKAIASFTDADWSRLGVIHLSGCKLEAWEVKKLVQANLPKLQCLFLAEASLSSACVSHLAKGHWPLLQVLDLSANKLDAEAMKYLEGMHLHWQVLMRLVLSHNMLPLSFINRLTGVHWTQLRILALDNVGLTAIAFVSLTHGQWPLLEVLRVADNEIVEKLYEYYCPSPNHDMQQPLPGPSSKFWPDYLLLLCCDYWPALKQLYL